MLRPTAAKLFATAIFLEATLALNACPNADTIYTGNGGVRYRICTGSDLIGESLQVTPNVDSETSCAQRCDQNMNCFKAVYNRQNGDCHFKGYNGLNWQPSDVFTVIQAEQVNIAQCPYQETTYNNNGVSYAHNIA